MITGMHALLYSRDPEADRAFFRDVLAFPYVEDTPGWLIFALPPAEFGVHPHDKGGVHEMYLMCDDVEATRAELVGKGVEFTSDIADAGFGLLTTLRLPSGAELGLYQPTHKTAI